MDKIDLGKISITTPEGEELIIDGTKICLHSSPEVCWEESPEMVQMRLNVASHEGWPIKREFSLHEALRRARLAWRRT